MTVFPRPDAGRRARRSAGQKENDAVERSAYEDHPMHLLTGEGWA